MSSHNPCPRLRPLFPKTVVAALAVVLATLATSPTVGAQDREHWVGTWATGLQAQLPPDTGSVSQDSSAGAGLFGRLIQIDDQIVRTSIGGSRVRVAFTNVFGTDPLEIGAAHVAVRAKDAAIDPDAAATLTFGGQPSAIIEAGSLLLSDPGTPRCATTGPVGDRCLSAG